MFAAATAYPQIAAAKVIKLKVTVALWVANGANVLEYRLGQFLKGPKNLPPRLALNSATGLGAPQGMVFDTSDDLW